MRHRKTTIKLGRKQPHRDAMLAAQVCSLIRHNRITTTVAKARATRRVAEKMVTLGKQGTLAARRRALATLRQEAPVRDLFLRVAPRFAERKGGYTRIVRLAGRRAGDSSEVALLAWTDYTPPPTKEKKSAKAKAKEAAGKPAR